MVQARHLGAGTGCFEWSNAKKAGRRVCPHIVILDAQSVKTAGRGEARGFDGGKWVKGRKRQIGVDSLGLLLGVRVHAANGADSRESLPLFKRLLFKFPHLQKVYADQAYRGQVLDYAMKKGHEVVVPEGERSGFKPESQRWVVERTFGWLGWYRRLSKDYEYMVNFAENWIRLAGLRIVLRKLCR